MRAAAAIAPAVLILGLLASASAVAGEGSRWYRLMVDGHKVGQAHEEEHVQTGVRIVVSENLMETQVDHHVLRQRDRLSARIDAQGRLQQFTVDVEAPGTRYRTEATLAGDGFLDVRFSDGKQMRTLRVAASTHAAVLDDDAAASASLLKPGSRIERTRFDPYTLHTFREVIEVIGPDAGPAGLTRLECIDYDGALPTRSSVWIDAHGRVVRSARRHWGSVLVRETVDEAAASAPNDPWRIVDGLSLPLPRALTAPEVRDGLALDVAASDEVLALLPRFGRQSVIPLDRGRARIVLHHTTDAAPDQDLSAPTPADTAATRFIEATDAAIVEAARRIGGEGAPEARLRRLQRYVVSSINDGLGTLYASAAETLRRKRGDCSEHALLFTALARASGIPARVAMGYRYVYEYGGHRHIFVPHAWSVVWLDGRWRSYDPSFGNAPNVLLMVSANDGDGFDSIFGKLFGQLQISAISAFAPPRGG